MKNTDGKFFLGNILDTESPLLYDPDDLTTHAVVLGMTGSGKTGLCIGLLEEAALMNIPALMIDPKGDITNARLIYGTGSRADSFIVEKRSQKMGDWAGTDHGSEEFCPFCHLYSRL